jgi:hypothetical protein
VVWGLGEKTAARKGAVPGMRIRFDQLTKESAAALKGLLKQLGAPERDPNAITQPVALAELKSRVAREQSATQPSAPPQPAVPPSPAAAAPARPSAADETLPHRATGPESRVATSQPRLLVQVQGLLMQIGELQQALSERESELTALKARLAEQETLLQSRSVELEKAERERRAAELAVQRLTMQLAARR